MGLSGTLMLAQENPLLNQYYEPYKEYVPFETLEDCVAKVKFYLKNESARIAIADAYAKRSAAKHMWKHRIEHVLRETNIIK